MILEGLQVTVGFVAGLFVGTAFGVVLMGALMGSVETQEKLDDEQRDWEPLPRRTPTRRTNK